MSFEVALTDGGEKGVINSTKRLDPLPKPNSFKAPEPGAAYPGRSSYAQAHTGLSPGGVVDVLTEPDLDPSEEDTAPSGEEFLRMYKRLLRKRLNSLTSPEVLQPLTLVFGSREWRAFKPVIKDADFRIQVAVGLVLKRIGDDPALSNLRQQVTAAIEADYGPSGLKVAKLVAFEGLKAIKDELAANGLKPRGQRKTIESFLRRAVRAVLLFEASRTPTAQEIATETRRNSPTTCVVSSHHDYTAVAASAVDSAVNMLGSQFGRSVHQGPTQYNAFLGKLNNGCIIFQVEGGWNLTRPSPASTPDG